MKRYGKAFWITLLLKQNNWHKHSVLGHTLKVTWELIKVKKYNLIAAALLHDIGKPLVAYQDDKDKITGEYSFHNHEEVSWYIIKDWPISDYTKEIVRHHYLIRGMKKAKEKGDFAKYRRQRKIWDKLSLDFKKDLGIFLKADDKGKKGWL